MPGTPYEVTKLINPTKKQILDGIAQAFAGSDEDDLCLFYYSGHGATLTGNLLPYDVRLSGTIALTDLKALLDAACGGQKLVIMDSCYSGNILKAKSGNAAEESDDELEATNTAVVNVFSQCFAKGLGKGSGDYLLLTAARYDEPSYGYAKSWGVFTRFLLEGSGYDEAQSAAMTSMAADENNNGMISLS